MRVPRLLDITAVSLVLASAAACGGGGDGGGGITPPTPVFTSFTVSPTNATVNVGATQSLTASSLDQNGQSMGGVTVTYSTSDATIANVSGTGVVTGVAVGAATITATGTRDGVTKTAASSITVQSAPPAGSSAEVTATTGLQFVPPSVTIAVGGTVRWTFQSVAHNVTFDGAAGAPTNISTKSNTTDERTFNQAGTFNYACTLHGGMNGTVVVR